MILLEKNRMDAKRKDKKPCLSECKIIHFQAVLKKWYASHKRTFPWIGIRDPYKIWLSEIILQQTRVAQGLPYYHQFLDHFPTITDLAEGEEQLIFRLWQGLGYYNRCKNLIKTAKIIAKEYQGHFPEKYDEIIQLPGIGPYTAAAISSFAFGLPYAVVDGNVERFLARYYGIAEPTNTAPGKKQFTQFATQLMDKKKPAGFNQAMMDFGATQCLPKSPLCDSCPFSNTCIALKEKKIQSLPVKKKKTKLKKRYLNYYVLYYEDQIFIRKRKPGDIWQSLHDFVLYESKKELSESGLLETPVIQKTCTKHNIREVTSYPVIKHQLTHQKLYIKFVVVSLREIPVLPEDYFSIHLTKADHYAFPRPLVRFLNKIDHQDNKNRQ